MLVSSDPQRSTFRNLTHESFVPGEHPVHRIWPLIDDPAFRRVCRPLLAATAIPGHGECESSGKLLEPSDLVGPFILVPASRLASDRGSWRRDEGSEHPKRARSAPSNSTHSHRAYPPGRRVQTFTRRCHVGLGSRSASLPRC